MHLESFAIYLQRLLCPYSNSCMTSLSSHGFVFFCAFAVQDVLIVECSSKGRYILANRRRLSVVEHASRIAAVFGVDVSGALGPATRLEALNDCESAISLEESGAYALFSAEFIDSIRDHDVILLSN